MKLRIPENHLGAIALPPTDWTLYRLDKSHDPERHSFLWLHFKLMRPPTTAAQWGQKRSYMLFWNPYEGRMAQHSEHQRLTINEPALYARVLLMLELDFDRAWIEAQYDPHEIAAECARLKARSLEAKARRAAAARV